MCSSTLFKPSTTSLNAHDRPAPALTAKGRSTFPVADRRLGQDVRRHAVVDVDEVSPLLTVLEDAGATAGPHLFGELVNHAGEAAFVVFAGAVDIAVAQADGCEGEAVGVAGGEVLLDDFAEGVDVERIGGAASRIGTGPRP